MTLGDLGNIGEFIAAIVVLISLIYLAIQIRQNTRQVRSSVQQASLGAAQTANTAVYGNADLAELVSRGLSDPSQLSDIEQFRFRMFAYTSIQWYEALYLQHQAGTIDEEYWQSRVEAMRYWFSLPGMAWYLENRPTLLAKSFREFIERDVRGGAA